MKITAIKTQVKRSGRYSLFVDEKYAFSLSADALLSSKVTVGLEVDEEKLGELKELSEQDKLYNAVLNYLAIRRRSQWEIETYLTRKGASPALADLILNTLSINHLTDDKAFAEAFVNDRRLLRPTSRRKLTLELRKKHVASSVIQEVLVQAEEQGDEHAALKDIISRKRKQTRYQDDLKLMQYLARQGFNYGDIKNALNVIAED